MIFDFNSKVDIHTLYIYRSLNLTLYCPADTKKNQLSPIVTRSWFNPKACVSAKRCKISNKHTVNKKGQACKDTFCTEKNWDWAQSPRIRLSLVYSINRLSFYFLIQKKNIWTPIFNFKISSFTTKVHNIAKLTGICHM